jgi:hypothetical protein
MKSWATVTIAIAIALHPGCSEPGQQSEQGGLTAIDGTSLGDLAQIDDHGSAGDHGPAGSPDASAPEAAGDDRQPPDATAPDVGPTTCDPQGCDDGIACTRDECVSGNVCAHILDHTACDDGDPCTEEACHPQSGCKWGPGNDGAACGPGQTCNAGTCRCTPHVATDCVAGDSWWVNGCGELEAVQQSCINGATCVAGVCRGPKLVGEECASDAECSTGYCYDEAFLGDFRFCSVDCSTGDPCSTLPNPDGSGYSAYQCLGFGQPLQDAYGLTVTSLCAPKCSDLAQCKAYSSQYDACGNSVFGTMWDGYTIGVKACIISSEM